MSLNIRQGLIEEIKRVKSDINVNFDEHDVRGLQDLLENVIFGRA